MLRSGCPIGAALDIVGDKWSMLILRDALWAGHTSYNEFLASPEGISTNILASRLAKLTELGIFEKKPNPASRIKFDYVLTNKGKDLAPTIMELGKWGNKHCEGTLDMQSCINMAQAALKTKTE